jgi:hypothetical protein
MNKCYWCNKPNDPTDNGGELYSREYEDTIIDICLQCVWLCWDCGDPHYEYGNMETVPRYTEEKAGK